MRDMIEKKMEKLAIDLETLRAQEVRLRKALEQCIANINAAAGAIQTCSQLLVDVDKATGDTAKHMKVQAAGAKS